MSNDQLTGAGILEQIFTRKLSHKLPGVCDTLIITIGTF